MNRREILGWALLFSIPPGGAVWMGISMLGGTPIFDLRALSGGIFTAILIFLVVFVGASKGQPSPE